MYGIECLSNLNHIKSDLKTQWIKSVGKEVFFISLTKSHILFRSRVWAIWGGLLFLCLKGKWFHEQYDDDYDEKYEEYYRKYEE